jgi:hypothetical protein
MKTKFYIIGILILLSSNNSYATISSCKDTLISVNKITMSRNSGIVADTKELLKNSSFSIIIDSSGYVELKWPGKVIKNNSLTTLTYSGKITKDDLNNLERYIKVTNLLNLEYYHEPEAEHPTCIIYDIEYNNNKHKKFIDCNQEIKILNTFGKIIESLKSEIKWLPNKN